MLLRFCQVIRVDGFLRRFEVGDGGVDQLRRGGFSRSGVYRRVARAYQQN